MHGFASLLRAQRTETVLTNLAWASVGIRHTTRSSQTGGGDDATRRTVHDQSRYRDTATSGCQSRWVLTAARRHSHHPSTQHPLAPETDGPADLACSVALADVPLKSTILRLTPGRLFTGCAGTLPDIHLMLDHLVASDGRRGTTHTQHPKDVITSLLILRVNLINYFNHGVIFYPWLLSDHSHILV